MSNSLEEIASVYYGRSPNAVRVDESVFCIYGTGGQVGFSREPLFAGPIVVVARKGTLNNPTYSVNPCWVIDTAYAVVSKKNFDAKWLYYNLSNYDLESLNEATGVPSISRDYLYRIRFYSPPLPQQRKIAKILTTVDNLIEKTEQLIAKYQSIKQGMMHDLFTRGVDAKGKLRPQQSVAPELYKQSELGWIPKEWEVMHLGDALARLGGFLQTGPFGSQLHSYEYVSEGIPVIMPQDIISGEILENNIARITIQKTNSLARHRVRQNDVVFSRRGELSRVAAISTKEEGWVCGTGCFLLRCPIKYMDSQWLARQYRLPHVQKQVDAKAVGSTMPSLNNNVMAGLVMIFTNNDEQVAIGNKIMSLEKYCHNQNNYLIKLRLQKTALMQDLLTGKVQVTPDAEDKE